eukprot:gene45915-57234_t
MEQAIRWGIMGTGKIAKAMAEGLRDTPGAELVAVASRSQESADVFGDEYKIPRRHATYQALADDPEVDVIYIATPHPMHHANAIMCLNAGKALLVEKSFTVNRRQAEEIVALARARKLFMMEAMWSRFMPAIVEAKRIVDSGEIGKPACVTADFGFASDAGPEHRLFNPELGGGGVVDARGVACGHRAVLFDKHGLEFGHVFQRGAGAEVLVGGVLHVALLALQ